MTDTVQISPARLRRAMAGCRLERGMSAGRLAEVSGVSRTDVASALGGKPTTKTVAMMLAAALNISVSDLQLRTSKCLECGQEFIESECSAARSRNRIGRVCYSDTCLINRKIKNIAKARAARRSPWQATG
jgi:transcriptional regulator with XRE-family HTH domain